MEDEAARHRLHARRRARGYQPEPRGAGGGGTSRTTGCTNVWMTCPAGAGVTLIVMVRSLPRRGRRAYEGGHPFARGPAPVRGGVGPRRNRTSGGRARIAVARECERPARLRVGFDDEAIALSAVVKKAAGNPTIALRCTSQAGSAGVDKVIPQDLKLMALEVGAVTGP